MPCRYVGTNTVSEEDTAKRQKKGDNKHTIVEQAHTTSLFLLINHGPITTTGGDGYPLRGCCIVGSSI
jgi:hypothetical protein